jgi:MFS family permease
MLAVLRQRNFGLFWFGQFISALGDWVLYIALPFYTFSLTGSALATGAMFMASTLPRLLFGSVAGVFVDRWDRKKTMIVADVLRAVIVLLLLVVRSPEWLWLIYLSSFAEALVSQFFVPAKTAIIPRLVSEKDLLTANSLNAFSDAITRLLGAALGGVLMSWLGLQSVILLDSASFLVSGILIVLIVLPAAAPLPPAPTHKPGGARGLAVWKEWLDGLRLVKQERLIASLFVVMGVAFLGDSMFSVLIVPLVKNIMGGSALQLSWVMMAHGIGGLTGGLILGQMGKSVSPYRLIILGLGLTGILALIIINFPLLPVVLPLMLFVGFVIMAWSVGTQTLLQMNIQDQYRGRIFGTLGTTMALMSLIGMGLAGALADLLGVVFILDIAAGLYIVSGGVAWVMLHEPAPVARSS